MIQKYSYLLCGFLIFSVLTHTVSDIKQDKVGNFSLPASQQPGPLFGFGQNMLDQHDLQYFTYIDQISGDRRGMTRVIPTFLYGIRDNFSLYTELSIIPQAEWLGCCNHGIQYILAQLEYAMIDMLTEITTTQVTLVGNMTFPTSTRVSLPYIGFGAPSFFLGSTASHFTQRWYVYAALGGLIPLQDSHGTKFGDQVLYQAGISRNLYGVDDQAIINLTLEMIGNYSEKSQIEGVINPNFGGNSILLAPSIWISTLHWSIQVGCGGYVFQSLHGIQNENSYSWCIDIGYKF